MLFGTRIENEETTKKHKRHRSRFFRFCLLCFFRGRFSFRVSANPLSDRLEFLLGVFAGNTVQEHAPTGQKTNDVKSAFGRLTPRH